MPLEGDNIFTVNTAASGLRSRLLITCNQSHIMEAGSVLHSLLCGYGFSSLGSCVFISALREQGSVASEALLLGFVQWGAAMQMEMGSRELTQDIISCQRFVAFL